jgi:AcrR family transcriptional regulator
MPAVKGRRPEQQSSRRAAVEGALLGATEALLAEGHSYTELSVEQITTRAGISRPAFYFYFQDKRRLLMRLVEGVADLFYVQADRWWSGEGGGRRDDLRAALAGVLEIYRAHTPLLAAIVEAAGYDEQIAAFWRRLTERFVDATEKHIAAERAAGRSQPIPAYSASWVLIWMTERAWYQHFKQPRMSDDELVEALTTVAWSSLYGRLGG